MGTRTRTRICTKAGRRTTARVRYSSHFRCDIHHEAQHFDSTSARPAPASKLPRLLQSPLQRDSIDRPPSAASSSASRSTSTALYHLVRHGCFLGLAGGTHSRDSSTSSRERNRERQRTREAERMAELLLRHRRLAHLVWCTYRAGFEPIRDLPGLSALSPPLTFLSSEGERLLVVLALTLFLALAFALSLALAFGALSALPPPPHCTPRTRLRLPTAPTTSSLYGTTQIYAPPHGIPPPPQVKPAILSGLVPPPPALLNPAHACIVFTACMLTRGGEGNLVTAPERKWTLDVVSTPRLDVVMDLARAGLSSVSDNVIVASASCPIQTSALLLSSPSTPTSTSPPALISVMHKYAAGYRDLSTLSRRTSSSSPIMRTTI
ncbi:hypothetical protein B0H11DRAFT_2259704 [Mycena galericulata]|nr:hypothetical protein B0H11DRAFT_2259704 [Mycena galericulata]